MSKGNPSREVEILKDTARTLYLSYRRILSAVMDGADCGRGLAEEIYPDLYRIKVQFNETMDKLALIDPAAPTDRL